MKQTTVNIHQELILQAKQNSLRAQGELYQLYYKAVYNSCLRIVNDRFSAEDLMQEAFIQAFKSIGQYKEEASFGSWIKKIAINLSINYLKRKSLLKEKAEVWENTQSGEDKDDDPAFQLSDIKLAMEKLAQQYRIIFSLYLIEGYDHEEIAEILGISSSTSRSQLSRAKQKMKKILLHQKIQQHEKA